MLSLNLVLDNFFSRFAEDRNNLEKLTLAVLSHLPTAVLYVHDLTGECGMSPSDQVSWLYFHFLIYWLHLVFTGAH